MKGKIKKVILWSITAVMVVSASIYGINNYVNVKAEETIDGKELISNGDGTYTLSLSATGASEKKVNKANVVVVFDVSGSMNTNTYAPNNQGGYGLRNGEYISLYYRTGSGSFWSPYQYHEIGSGTYNGTVYRSSGYNSYTQYTGDRYESMGTRLSAAKTAVNNLANSLLSNNTASNNDIIELALVSFSNTATTVQGATTSYNTFSNAVNRLTANGGTNWEAALIQAKEVSFGANDNDPTYVIFVSDGNPTFHSTNGGYNNWNNQYGVYGSGQEQEPNITRSYDQAKDDAKALVDNGYELYTVGIYGNVDRMKDLVTYSGEDVSEYYFSADDTEKLTEALNAILHKIETAGIGQVSIEDGTTESVSTDSGKLNLLTIDYTDEDVNSFKYWLSIPVTETENGNYTGKINNIDATITKNSDGSYTCTWGDNNEKSLIGTVEGGMFKYQWTGANDLYNKEAPKATLADSKVNWDLSSLGILLNGVTYTVTFDVWPSQETYDLISDIDNGITTYGSLDDEVKKYLKSDGNGGYTLRTNTTATLTYTDTRISDKAQTAIYKNPEPVDTGVSKMTVKKLWDNLLDEHHTEVTEISLNVLKDNKKYGNTIVLDNKTVDSVTGNAKNKWEEEVFISTGLMSLVRDNNGNVIKAIVREKGHNYTFSEIENGTYYWDLAVETVRPMIVNEIVNGESKLVLKTFVKVKDNAPVIGDSNVSVVDGVTYYKIDGDVYYIREANAAIMNATNIRRSHLNITKKVTGNDAPKDAKFTFTLKVNDYLGNTVWFSVRDENNQRIKTANVSANNLGRETDDNGNFNGYYFVPSGTEITVDLQADWNLRFTNLSTGSTYTFEETTMPSDFVLDKIDATEVSVPVELLPMDAVSNGDGTYTSASTGLTYKKVTANGSVYYTYVGKAKVTGQKTEGTIFVGNTIYDVIYTNDYLKTNISGEKIWTDGDNQDGKRPDTITLSVIAKVDGERVPSLENPIEVKPDKDGVWKFSQDLDRYYNGKEVEYSINEIEVAGYESKITIDKDGNYVITNTHTPEKTQVSTTKVWSDGDNQDGKRPPAITVNLLADGKKVASCVTGSENNYACSFINLDKYAAGSEIKYTVTEDAVAGYTTGITGTAATGYVITNSYTPEKTQVSTTKVWSDGDNQDGKRPANITVNLLANGKKVDSCVTDSSKNYACTFANLDKYAAGSEIRYTVSEDTVAGYTAGITGTAATGYVITNTHTPEKTDIKGVKAWADANDLEGYRPKFIKVSLVAKQGDTVLTDLADTKEVRPNTSGEWIFSFANLPKYRNGKLITYSVVEEAVANYDDPTYEYDSTSEYPYIIVNTHSPKNLDVTVKKDWDEVSVDGIINQFSHDYDIKVRLVGMVGENTYYDQTETVSLDDAGDWSYTFIDLPEYREGKLVEYTAYEVTDAKDYSVTSRMVKVDTLDDTTELRDHYIYTITNKYNPGGSVTISGEKNWDDATDQDGIRPDKITINLIAKQGDTVLTELADSVTVRPNNDGKWLYEFTNLPKNHNGVEIVYTLEEVGVDGYTVTMDNYNITNTHTPEVVSFSISKIWNDNDNNDGFRPDKITVRLFANDVEVASRVATAENNWSCEFVNFPKYNQGNLIVYKIVEDEVKAYSSEVKAVSTTGNNSTYEIVNTHEDEVVDLTIDKTWDDYDDISNIRPNEILVDILQDGKYFKTVSITVQDDWAKTFSGFAKWHNGILYRYDIVEHRIAEYDAKYMKNGYKFNIINHHELGIGGGPQDDVEELPPQTGIAYDDSAYRYMYIILMLISILGFRVRFGKNM